MAITRESFTDSRGKEYRVARDGTYPVCWDDEDGEHEKAVPLYVDLDISARKIAELLGVELPGIRGNEPGPDIVCAISCGRTELCKAKGATAQKG